jgi:biotin synthase
MRKIMKFTELEAIYQKPLFELVSLAHEVHKKKHRLGEIKLARLISIKTGGCPEDCRYCAQSSRYKSTLKPTPMMARSEVLARARQAKKEGISRICLGAAWRSVRESSQFEEALEMVKEITSLGLEVCCTFGMLTRSQAEELKCAGLHAYNHNLDSSEDFYKTIITTRTYEDRLQTLDVVDEAGIHTCCGGILGLGETEKDRLMLIHTLFLRKLAPESIPVNLLVPIPGTPLEKQMSLSFWELLRFVATLRVVFPQSAIRLAAGRERLNEAELTLCFFAGVNSLFSGEHLLTVRNVATNQDELLFSTLGLVCTKPYQKDAVDGKGV